MSKKFRGNCEPCVRSTVWLTTDSVRCWRNGNDGIVFWMQAAFASVTVWLFPAPVEMTSELSKELTSEDLSEVGISCRAQRMLTNTDRTHFKCRVFNARSMVCVLCTVIVGRMCFVVQAWLHCCRNGFPNERRAAFGVTTTVGTLCRGVPSLRKCVGGKTKAGGVFAGDIAGV